MSAHPHLLIPRQAANATICEQPSTSSREIAVRISLHAEPLRVFHALTVPEYRETWVSLPDGKEGYSVAASESEASYRIELSRGGVPEVRISGIYYLRQPDAMVFSWRACSTTITRETTVHIHLKKNAGRCMLDLRHRGFTSVPDRLWHRRFWILSLERLAWLLEHSCS